MSIKHISDLIPDDKNFNRHTERGSSLVKKSLERLGFGRSILIDKNGKIIAGNLTTEEAGQMGIQDVEVIKSDGTKIIAVQRTDIDLDTPKGRELALADNRTSEVSLNLDTALIEEVFIDEPEIVEEYYFADELTVEELPEAKEEQDNLSLAEKFIVPPFSVLDARQGYWQERKKLWATLGIKSELGRGGGLTMQSKEVTTQNLNYYRNLNK